MAMSKKFSCCLFGCLGTTLTLIFVSFGFIWYLTKTGDFEEDATVYIPNGHSYMRAIIRPEDEALLGLLADLAVINQDMSNQEMPEDLRWLGQFGNKDRATMLNEFKSFTPLEFEMTYLGDNEVNEGEFVFGVGFGRNKNLIAWGYSLLRRGMREEGETAMIADQEVIHFQDGNQPFFLHLQNGVVYISQQEDAMGQVLSGDTRQVGVDQALNPLYRINTDATMYGFLTKDALPWLPNFIASDAATNDWIYENENLVAFDTTVTQMGFDMQAKVDNQLEVNYFIFCEPGEAFAAHLGETEQRLKQGEVQGDFTVTVTPTDFGYQMSIQLTDIEALVRNFFEKLQEEERAERNETPLEESDPNAPVETESFQKEDP